jgi:hypothetical protein
MMPVDLAFQIENRLMDPVTKKATYAARSKLIQSLLYTWLKDQGVKLVVPAAVICPGWCVPEGAARGGRTRGARQLFAAYAGRPPLGKPNLVQPL